MEKRNRRSNHLLRRLAAVLLIVLLAGFGLVLAGCDTTGASETPKVLSSPEVSINTSREGISISWNAVANAEEYILYWSLNDNEVKEIDQLGQDDIYFATINDSSNKYEHKYITGEDLIGYEGLPIADFEHNVFNYLLVAKADGYTSASSDIIPGIGVDIFMSATIDFGALTENAGFRLYEVPYDQVAGTVNGPLILLEELTANTDAEGLITFDLDLDRGVYHGYTVFIDQDDSGTLTEGDLVWGGKQDGSHTYSFWNGITNFNRVVVRNWEGESSPANGLY
ncbi:hypothetical protein [Spirochaeta dissipatitropha]